MYGSVVEGGGRGAASGLWLEGWPCNVLTVMLWRLECRDSGLKLEPKTQTHQYAQLSRVSVRVRVESSFEKQVLWDSNPGASDSGSQCVGSLDQDGRQQHSV